MNSNSCSFVIKNTFITIPVEKPGWLRRSSSAPASGRKWNETGHPESSGVSTSGHGEGDENGSSFGSDSDSIDSIEVTHATARVDLKLSELLRTKLKTSSTAWVPGSAASPPLVVVPSPVIAPLFPSDVRQAFVALAEAAKCALERSSPIIFASCEECGPAFNVVARVLPCYYDQLAAVLSKVSDAIVAASHNSKYTYILGAGRSPFTTLGCGRVGFSSTMAILHDAGAVCWSLLAHGYCSRGYACRWRHPCWTSSLNVAVDIVHSVA